MDPRQPPDIVGFKHLCRYLLDYANQYGGLNADECDCIALVVYHGHRKKRAGPYDDLDGLAASLAISTFSRSST